MLQRNNNTPNLQRSFLHPAQHSRDGQQYRPAFGGVLPTARIIAESEYDADAYGYKKSCLII